MYPPHWSVVPHVCSAFASELGSKLEIIGCCRSCTVSVTVAERVTGRLQGFPDHVRRPRRAFH